MRYTWLVYDVYDVTSYKRVSVKIEIETKENISYKNVCQSIDAYLYLCYLFRFNFSCLD